LKGWITVRVICFILILVFCFTALSRVSAVLVRYDGTGVNPEVILSNLSAEQQFLRQNMDTPQYYASVLAFYGSEEAILAGTHIQWFSNIWNYYTFYDYDWYMGERYGLDITMYELRTPGDTYVYATIDEAEFKNDMLRRRHEEAAIRQQLGEFRIAKDVLDNTEGLLYYISVWNHGISTLISDYSNQYKVQVPQDIVRTTEQLFQSIYGDNVSGSYIIENFEENVSIVTPEPMIAVFTNVDEYDQVVDFFKAQPVYFLIHSYGQIEYTGDFYNHHLYFYLGQLDFSNEDASIYLAFSTITVHFYSQIFTSARNAYITDFSIIAACVVLVLAMVIILMFGAGRQTLLVDGQKVRSQEIHLSRIDKIYLDIGLAFIIIWTVFIFFVTFYLFATVWQFRNITAMNIVIASAVIFTVPAALFWLLNLTKRIKIGKFWRHTLIYATLCFVKRTAKSLWTSVNFALKITLITVSSFLIMIFVTWFTISSNSFLGLLFITLLASSAIALLLTLYARRIHKLEIGALAASKGRYDELIDVGGGELGRIASSINSISAGINIAVEERMKSERLKTELITNVSHDIRTPLTSIITYTDLLESEGLDCEKASDYLSILKQKSLRLKTLTEELFEAAKASTGNIDVNLADLNIVSLINQVLGELDTTIKASGLDLRVSLPDKLIAIADGRLMQRVMENLLSNVFKYSLPGSRVYLDVLPASDNEIRIDLKNVSSMALNFDPSELMERFKRGDDSRTDGGSGLGLSIVQSFVSAQGGKFEIKIDGDLFKATVILPQPKE